MCQTLCGTKYSNAQKGEINRMFNVFPSTVFGAHVIVRSNSLFPVPITDKKINFSITPFCIKLYAMVNYCWVFNGKNNYKSCKQLKSVLFDEFL